MSKVHFADKVEVHEFDKDHEIVPVKLVNVTQQWWLGIPEWTWGLVSILLLAIFVVWVIALVKMGRCGGRKSWLWWVTIFVPLFVPFVGQAWALVVGIMALVILGRGGELAGMKCSK